MQPSSRSMRVPHPPGRPTPLFWLTGGVLSGQAAAAAGAAPTWRWAIGIVALVALAVWATTHAMAHRRLRTPMATAFARHPARGAWRAWYATIAAALLAALVGHWQLDRLLRPTLPADHVARLIGERALLRGHIAERPAHRSTKTRLVVEITAARRGAEWQPASGLLLVTVREVRQAWQRGDAVEALLEVRQPRNFGNPGEFDFSAYLARRGIYATAFAAADTAWLRAPAAPGLGAGLEAWRNEVAHVIATALDPTIAAIVGALLIGDAIALPADVRDRYARAGV